MAISLNTYNGFKLITDSGEKTCSCLCIEHKHSTALVVQLGLATHLCIKMVDAGLADEYLATLRDFHALCV